MKARCLPGMALSALDTEGLLSVPAIPADKGVPSRAALCLATKASGSLIRDWG